MHVLYIVNIKRNNFDNLDIRKILFCDENYLGPESVITQELIRKSKISTNSKFSIFLLVSI
jgi:hypothetical protein